MQAWGILVDGHPTDDYNGAYQKTIPQDAGMERPTRVLKNPRGMYCYRHEPKDMWILRNKLTPDKPNCNACIVSEFGPLPVGKRTWKLSPTAVGKPKGESDALSEHALSRGRFCQSQMDCCPQARGLWTRS